jgi:DNA-binding response OmpR family regulator
MPRLNGLELCRQLELHSSTAGIPAILLTSRDFEMDAIRIAGTSIRLIEGKPFSPRRIIAAVSEMLSPVAPT